MRRPRCLAALTGAALLTAALLTAAVLLPSAPAGAAPSTATLPAPKASILVDAGSGRVLAGVNVHEAMHPASTAKIMTALTAVERLAPTAIVTACPGTDNIEENKIGFHAGTRWPLDEILAAMMMVSANDAAYAVGCTLGKNNLDTWAAMVNDTARQLKLRDSTLGDPAGLDTAPSYKGGPFMSAYDLAIATRNALTVPAIAKWSALRQYAFKDPQGVSHSFLNHDKMLPGAPYAYLGSNGFKTGFTNQANHTLVATATRNGRQLIAVVLGAADSGYAEAGALLDAGFAMPANAAGLGETLPPVAVSTYATRAADQTAFQKLGSPAAGTSNSALGASTVTVPAVVPVLDAVPHAAAAPVASAATSSPKHSGGGGGILSLRNIVILLILAGGVTFFLRRRAVRRNRAQRLARKRQRAAAMRSGGLPVVDGRYRAGMRLGPPVESHVRVRRDRRQGTG